VPCPSACQPRGPPGGAARSAGRSRGERADARWLDARAVAELVAALVLRHGAGGLRAVLEAPAPNALNGKFSWFGCGFAFGVWSGALRSHGVPARRPARAAADMLAPVSGRSLPCRKPLHTRGRVGRDLSEVSMRLVLVHRGSPQRATAVDASAGSVGSVYYDLGHEI